ncbi:uncharacterized protein EAF01_006894 [Botrytis porri]|uniref:uncharacterized protein n=1 Tax=Botrytis porri TaxID=87229 RepID=UPI001901585E|nr:uncharacterized protein EAF01_006894 [Botrytis porri]KAF7901595.1 hypothetical protein EAF01_006894 [Botrytis porri]
MVDKIMIQSNDAVLKLSQLTNSASPSIPTATPRLRQPQVELTLLARTGRMNNERLKLQYGLPDARCSRRNQSPQKNSSSRLHGNFIFSRIITSNTSLKQEIS